MRIHPLPLRFSSLFSLGMISCAFSFTNAQNRPSPEYRSLYIPAAADYSTRGGASARLSRAVRASIATNTRFVLSEPESARVGVDLKIRNRRQSVAVIELCTTLERKVGSGAFDCPKKEDEPSLFQPDRASAKESIAFDVDVRLIDLKNGAVLGGGVVSVKEGDLVFPVVAEKDGAGATVRAGLASSPQLHSLRYLENTDNALTTIGERVATQIVAMLQTLHTP